MKIVGPEEELMKERFDGSRWYRLAKGLGVMVDDLLRKDRI